MTRRSLLHVAIVVAGVVAFVAAFAAFVVAAAVVVVVVVVVVVAATATCCYVLLLPLPNATPTRALYGRSSSKLQTSLLPRTAAHPCLCA